MTLEALPEVRLVANALDGEPTQIVGREALQADPDLVRRVLRDFQFIRRAVEGGDGSYEGTNLAVEGRIYNLCHHDGGVYCFLDQRDYEAIVVRSAERIEQVVLVAGCTKPVLQRILLLL